MIKQIIWDSYRDFQCLAGACPDTCCQQWDIDVDEKTYAAYQALPGALGDKIRAHLHEGEDGPVITLEDGQCPMHRSDGLCQIQAELGAQALCDTCRDFPRLCHDYGDFQELQLELSCPEAARLLLTRDPGVPTVRQLPQQGDPDYDEDAMALLLSTRDTARTLVTGRDPAQGLILLFFYGLSVQRQLDGEDGDFSPEAALETAAQMAQAGDFREIPRFFADLDVLTQEWSRLLFQAERPQLSSRTGRLAACLIDRYWLQAVSDYDLYCRVKFILITCLLVGSLPGDFVWNAHLYSKEIENDCENLEAILDGAYDSPIFTDAKLLSYLQQAKTSLNC